MESLLTGSLLPLVVVILNMWSLCLALDANFQCAFLCLEERDANFRADLMDSLLTGSLLPPVVVVLNT